MGDLNVHFDRPNDHVTAKVLQLLQMFDLSQAVDVPTHQCGHTLDPIIYREGDGLLRSFFACHALSSDHTAKMCHVGVNKPPHHPVFQIIKNLRNIDRTQFCADLAATLNNPPPTSAGDFNWTLRAVLDSHAPATCCVVIQRRSTPWYSTVAPELRSLKQERRRAERRWLSTGLTVHKQIMNSIKHQIIKRVLHALKEEARRMMFSRI